MTVPQVVGGGTRYLLVNRVYRVICELQDGSESAWAEAGSRSWCPDDAALVRLFVLVYLWAGCDFFPAISKLPFLKLWGFALKTVRSPGLFKKPLFFQEGGMWTVDLFEGVKRLATAWFFKHEAAFARGTKTPATFFLQTVTSGNTSRSSG